VFISLTLPWEVALIITTSLNNDTLLIFAFEVCNRSRGSRRSTRSTREQAIRRFIALIITSTIFDDTLPIFTCEVGHRAFATLSTFITTRCRYKDTLILVAFIVIVSCAIRIDKASITTWTIFDYTLSVFAFQVIVTDAM